MKKRLGIYAIELVVFIALCWLAGIIGQSVAGDTGVIVASGVALMLGMFLGISFVMREVTRKGRRL